MNTIEEDPTDYTLRNTDLVLDWLRIDIARAKDDPKIVWETQDVVFKANPPAYRPPGIWCRYVGDRSAFGSSLLWWFPEPYHPLEVLAAKRGMGGFKSTSTPNLTPLDLDHVGRASATRYSGWFSYTALIAKHLGITPAQARVLYHCFTPLAVNGSEPNGARLSCRAISAKLYHAVLGEESQWATRCLRAWRSADMKGVPTRMRFWGDEVSGRVEL